jgi:hypothetical protein
VTLQPFAVADATLDWFRRYVRAGFPLRDEILESQREDLIDGGLLWAPTYVKLERPGVQGPPLGSLRGTLLDRTIDLPWGFTDLYDHQVKAITRLAADEPKNTLILSGTGSGKTEGFMIPIVDACLRSESPGVKALVIYPMNALANDQLKRLRELLVACPDVSFGRYTGDTPELDAGDPRRPGRPADAPANMRWSRQAMRDEPPDILLTNYTMLEYLLLRRKDEELFRHGAPRFLVVDEIHLFAGVLGAEVASLLRRFRQHVAGTSGGMCMVGTSATAGSEAEEEELARFAARFFGASFDKDALVTETPTPLEEPTGSLPPPPVITDDLLRSATDVAGVAALAKATFGVDLPVDNEFSDALGGVIDGFATVGVVEGAFARPGPVTAGADALKKLPEREGVEDEAILREAEAILLLGATARVAMVGEDVAEPRFRPRLHQVLRSPAGLWRCLDPAHGCLVAPDEGHCSCDAMTLPLASCRTCGEAYWSSQAPKADLDSVVRLHGIDVDRGLPAVLLADPQRISELVDEDEEGNKVTWARRRVCPWCGAVTTSDLELEHDRRCPKPLSDGVVLLASTDDVHCPACGDLGARNRPIVLPLKGSAAASTAVVTQGLADELRAETDEAGGRLLVFADSRQNAAQQAGYAADQGARIAVRQLVTKALGDKGALSLKKLPGVVADLVMSDEASRRRWLVGESERNFIEVSNPEYVMSDEDRRHIEYQLTWEIALEATERARRRFSLEREGVIVMDIDGLDALVETARDGWPTCPFDHEHLTDVIRAVVDVMRYGRAVSVPFLKLSPRTVVKNHGVRIGDPAITQTRGYGPKKYSSRRDGIDIRAWTDPKHTTRLMELLGRVMSRRPAEANDVVDSLVGRLQAVGLLTAANIEGRRRFMVDRDRLLFRRRDEASLWRCDRCGTVRNSLLRAVDGAPLCVGWRCGGTPKPFEPQEARDFYARQYVSTPRRFIVREHSGQIEGDVRLELESRFNDREHPIIDALAATPTLEVGVSLDDLHAVVLRNLPPTPANYAQRVGRAGRRSKIGLAVAHAGHGPHDAYYFGQPGEMIAGLVRAPAISLDNEPLLRRHVNSLIFEVLSLDLPGRWVPNPEESEEEQEWPTIADEAGVIRETTLKPFEDALADLAVRAQAEEAIRGAFASPNDPEPPDGAEEIGIDQLDRFLGDLRSSLMRWTERYRALLEEFKKAQAKPGLPSRHEKEYLDRIYREIARMANPSSPDQQPLGFLGVVGFFPRYGFTGTSVLLHPRGADEPLVQAGGVAVTEYAPGNLVYARGRRLKVDRFDPAPVEEASIGPEHRENVLSLARRCDACEYLTEEPLEKTCPTCNADLISQPVLHLTGVAGGGRQISSEDEYRRRSDYVVRHILGPAPATTSVVEMAGYRLEWSRGRRITVANAGRVEPDGGSAQGFAVCTSCGLGAEYSPPGDEDDGEGRVGHRPFCPAAKDPNHVVVKNKVWLTAAMQGDVFELELPIGMRGPTFSSWRATIAESLLLGIRETMQAGRRDLDWFTRKRKDEPVSLVFFDTMPGGTGFVPKLFADGAAGLKAAAAEALERLVACTCSGSCHRCLRDFWNQRLHQDLDRFTVLTSLKRLAAADVVEGVYPDDEKLESFLEQEFYERLADVGIPRPTLQVIRVLGKHRIIRVDCEYRDPDVSVFLDGRAYHAQSTDKIIDDLEVRNRLEAQGVFVLEFTYADVMERFAEVARLTQLARTGETEPLDVSSLEGLKLLDRDDATHRIVAEVDPQAWVESESARQAALDSSNAIRAAGYRLKRVPRR